MSIISPSETVVLFYTERCYLAQELLLYPQFMNLFASLFGDPTIKVLHLYQKDLQKIKKIEEEYRKSILTVEEVQAKTQEFKTRFAPVHETFATEKTRIEQATYGNLEDKIEAIKKNNARYIIAREEMVQSLKFEALALHRRACEIIYDKKFTLSDGSVKVWNMIPFDVQVLGALTLNS